MHVHVGDYFLDAKVDKLQLEDFNKREETEVICKILEQTLSEYLNKEMRDKLRLNDTIEAIKLESHITAYEDVIKLIRVGIPAALRENE